MVEGTKARVAEVRYHFVVRKRARKTLGNWKKVGKVQRKEEPLVGDRTKAYVKVDSIPSRGLASMNEA